MTYAKKTLSEIKLIHGNYGNFIKGQKLDKKKEKKYKMPPYQDLAASNEIDGEPLDEKCWPGYEKKGMKTMFGKRYPNCVKKKKTRKEDFSDWRSDLGQIDEKAVSKQQQKFFGMVRATQKGEMDNPSDEVQKAADSMTKKDVKKYASTKHSKLPDKIEEKLDSEDKPFVKKLVGKLRKGSKTHAKQADDLENAMNEDITDEALTIQNWNVDDIKFTEIETVDIIKAKPLKENVKKKIIVKGLKALGNLSKKTKIKSISPKPVATPGTTYATGGRFPSGTFSNVPDYAGALPKATKTGGQMYSTTYDLGTKLSPGPIKPVKGAFKGGGSLKGRIDPGTGNRVSFKQYKDIMKTQYGKNYYEPVKGAKFGDKIMATNRKAFEPAIKQEKLPYPKPRGESKFKVRDDATFGDQIMVRKNKPFSRNFTGRTPMPKPLGKAKYEVGKKGVDEFRGGDMYSKVGFRSFKDKKYGFPGLKKPASAPKDASRLYEPKGYRDYTPKRDMPTTNPEAGRVLFGKGELKTGVKKKGKTIYKENMDLDEGIKRKFIKKLAKKIAKQLSKKKPKITGSTIKDVSKKYVPPSKVVSQNIQTKSIINQVKKASDLSSKPVKGTKPVKVDVSKLDIDKYFGGTKSSSGVKKKFGSKRPTGTFTDDAPKVKREPLIKAKPGDAEKTEKLIRKYEIGDKIEKKYPGRENAKLKKKMYKRLFGESNWREELGEDWQKVNRKDKTDGMSKAAVKAYRRENPGSKLKTAVTKDPKKLKKGSKSAKRRLSFCRRMKGMKKRLTSAKTARDPNSRINKALRRWNC